MQETQETQVRSLGQEDPLEEEMATHSSILAWEIPWTEEPGGLQYMGQRVGHDRACVHTHPHTSQVSHTYTPPRCHTHTPGVTHTHTVSHTHTHTHTHTHPMCLVRGGETVSKSGRLLPVSKPGDEWVWPVPPDPEGTRTLSNRGTFLSLDSHLLLLPNCSLLGC